MKVSAIRSDEVYSKIMSAPPDRKNDIYRYELMMPFERKWACYNVPIKAKTPGGYDVIRASELLGHIAPTKVDDTQKQNIQLISDDELAKLQNFPQAGLPYCAGYACGYHFVKHYLKKTGKSIVEATLLPAKEILDAGEDFWND